MRSRDGQRARTDQIASVANDLRLCGWEIGDRVIVLLFSGVSVCDRAGDFGFHCCGAVLDCSVDKGCTLAGGGKGISDMKSEMGGGKWM